jgi:hypothetical protein
VLYWNFLCGYKFFVDLEFYDVPYYLPLFMMLLSSLSY